MRRLVLLAILLNACGGTIAPLQAVLDFGTVYLPGTTEGSTPLENESRRELTVQTVEITAPEFLYIGRLPLVMDAQAEYPLDFSFTAAPDGFGTFAADATVTVVDPRGNPTPMSVSLTAVFEDGDVDRDGFVGTAWGGDDCDDGNAASYPEAQEICDGEDNDCDGEIGSAEIDQDGDGFGGCDDCDDTDAGRRPGATEGCDGLDTDCDGELGTDERDGDSDLWTACNGDCGPADPAVHPGATEQCDGLDNDCSTDGVPPDNEADQDADGYATCEGDCDDAASGINPGRPTDLCDGADTDCDNILPPAEADADEDGVATCEGDCDDTLDTRFPGNPEVCDGIDNDCAAGPDADPEGEVDVDGDGSRSCDDCDDDEPLVFPGNSEACDGLDSDCDPLTSVGSEVDGDGDGARACADCADTDASNFPANGEVCDGQDNDCDPATGDDTDFDGDGLTACNGDCDDGDATRYVGATEVCDGVDNDCDLAAPGEQDDDGDAAPACSDCDDADEDRFPTNPEVCDGVDNDCNAGTVPSGGEADADADGSLACEDCADGDPARFPANPEICDGQDNDCDAATSAPPGEMDLDEDGTPICGDCDDADPYSYPGHPELCDLADNDCDPTTVETADTDSDGLSLCDGDCDDTDAAIAPGNAEVCDGVDNDCDGALALGEAGDGDGDGTLDCADSICPFWVDAAAVGSPDGSQAAPYPAIPAALSAAAAASCGTVWVRPGTYSGLLTLPDREWRLEATASGVILDGGATGPILTVSGSQTTATVLRGLTLRNATTLADGGAIAATSPGLTLESCTIEDNGATGAGGGIWASGTDLVIVGSTIAGNTAAGHGGGVFATGGSLTVIDTLLEGNESAGGDGGGIYHVGVAGEALEITGSVIQGNTAFDDGGGAFLQTVNGVIQQTEFVLNACNDTDVGRGGALYLTETTGVTRIRNNVFVANLGGLGSAIFSVSAAPTIDNNTIIENAATAIAEPSTVRLFEGVARNNIIAFNTGWGVDDEGSAQFSYNDVHGNTIFDWFFTDRDGINGNIDANPSFVSYTADFAYADDLSLQGGSVCRNTGHPGTAFTEPDGTRADMGAFGGPGGSW